MGFALFLLGLGLLAMVAPEVARGRGDAGAAGAIPVVGIALGLFAAGGHLARRYVSRRR